MGMATVGKELRALARRATCVLASLALACALVPAASVAAFAASTTYTQITTGGSVDITVDGESEYLSLTTSEDGYYRFEWETDDGQVELLVYETDGTLIAESDYWGDWGELYVSLEADTTYYIECSPYNDDEEIEVTVSVSYYEMSGTCGDDVTWSLLEDDDGSLVLTIAGTGAMYDYGYDDATDDYVYTPWSSFDELIVELVVGSGVTSIGAEAFNYLYELETVSIASTVTAIGEYAFSGCWQVESIELPSGLTSIGESAFSGCESLTSIDVPAGCSIGGGAFEGCWGLVDDDGFVIVNDILFDYANDDENADVVVPDGIVEISSWAFWLVTVASITLPESVTVIGDCAFEYSSFASINIPDACESIGAYAFEYCDSLTSIDVPASCSIGDGAFSGCWGLLEDDFIIVNGILFDYSYLTRDESVTIPDGVTEIDVYAFAWEDITSVVICDSVESIDECAFYDCEDLETIVFEGDAPAFAETSVNEYFDDDDEEWYYEEWGVFSYVEACAYYPDGNDTWTADVMLDYGGDITWVAYTDDSYPDIVDTTLEFADVASDAWYYDAVYYLADLGLITGYTSGSQVGLYGVSDNLTRGQLVTILWRNACPDEYAEYVAADAVNETSFTDVADGQYYTEAVNWAVEEGYVTGYTSTTFAPNKSITFQETCIVIARVATDSTDPEPDESASSILSEFKDCKDVSSWAQDGVAWCVENGIVSGYASGTNAGKLLPKEKMKRVRIAQVVYNALIEGWI